MKFMLIMVIIAVPIGMAYGHQQDKRFTLVFNSIAVISTIIFGSIASIYIYQILTDHAVYTTAIHGIFLNPFFLFAGAYLGLYTIYRLLMLTLKES